MNKTKAFKRLNCEWTPEEIQFLLDNFGEVELEKYLKQLQRTELACSKKFYDLTGLYDAVTYNAILSTDMLAETLGVSNKTILTWTQEYGLPYIKLRKKQSDEKNGIHRRYSFEHTKVLRWIKSNMERIDFANVKLGIICNEPDWLYEKVKQAQQGAIIKRPKNWLKYEDEFLFNEYFYKNRIVEDIAQDLQRPCSGTQRRLTVLRKKAEKEGFVFERARGAGGRTRIVNTSNAVAL